MYGHPVIATVLGIFAFIDALNILLNDDPGKRAGGVIGAGIYGYAAYLLW